MNQRPQRGVSMNHNEVLFTTTIATNHDEVLLDSGVLVGEHDAAPVRGVVLNHNEVLS
jgi:hypothetical protein